MAQIISLNRSISWGIKTFFKHWQLALIAIVIETAIFLLFKDTASTSIISIEPSQAFVSLDEIDALAMQPQHNYLLKLMQVLASVVANLIFIPCALALYQRGSTSYKDVITPLPVIFRYIVFIFGYVLIAAIALLCFQGAYYLFTMKDALYNHFSHLNSMIPYLIIGIVIPLLCLVGAYLVARYYLGFCVLFHERLGLGASFKRAAQLAQDNWIAIAVLFAIEALLLNSPLYFMSILFIVHAYGTARGAEPYKQV